jgi:hypothetical protein
MSNGICRMGELNSRTEFFGDNNWIYEKLT